MYMIMCVVHDPEKCQDLLNSWEVCGVSGATILHSTGLGRLRNNSLREDLPLFPGLDDLLKNEEYFSRTIFTVLDREDKMDLLIQETEKVLGSLSQPETGLLVVIPVLRAYGLTKQGR